MRVPKISIEAGVLAFFMLFSLPAMYGHPMPTTIVNLSITEQRIFGEAKMPLEDFAIAFGKPKTQILWNDPKVKNYFLKHIGLKVGEVVWKTKIESLKIKSSQHSIVGNYQELWLNFSFENPGTRPARRLTFAYDAILHQIITHKVLVYVVQDWDSGLMGTQQFVGEIALNIPKGSYSPLTLNLGEGKWWKGFAAMMSLGMHHIEEGNDHLLFLLVLLMPCMLRSEKNQWTSFAGASFGIKNMLRLVTAFTLGHSITLFIGAFRWFSIPQQWVEIWIALSILISSLHAYRPLFSKKEAWIVLGFGFLHGLAFASILLDMHLTTSHLLWSILGFNLGIECMQLWLLCLVFPLIFVLSKKPIYVPILRMGALAASFLAFYWLLERLFFF